MEEPKIELVQSQREAKTYEKLTMLENPQNDLEAGSSSSFSEIMFEIPISYTNGQILDKFEEFAKSNSMNAWRLERNRILAVSVPRSRVWTAFSSICGVFSGKCGGSTESSVFQLKIAINKARFNKRLVFMNLKGVFTDYIQFERFCDEFQKDLTSKPNRMVGTSFGLIEPEFEDPPIETCVIESNSAYIFHKILLSSSYDIGQRVQAFLCGFSKLCRARSSETGLFYVNAIDTTIEEIVENIYSDFNYGKAKTKHIMPFCRMITERFFYKKLYPDLIEVYAQIHKEKIAGFERVKRAYREEPQKLLDFCQKRETAIGLDPAN